MKGLQFNYFATGDDLNTVANTVLCWDPELLLFRERGCKQELLGTPVDRESILIPNCPSEEHLLCAAADAHKIKLTPISESELCIHVQDNPVIEYSPSTSVADGIVQIGRFYARFSDPEFRRRVKRLFILLKANATPLNDSDLWIFPCASSAVSLRPWVGKDWVNPLTNLT